MARILLVDDDEHVHHLVSGALTEHSVVWASSWSDISEHLLEGEPEPFDLVLLDLRMPFLDGQEVATLVRRRHADLKIVLFSACDKGELQRRAGEVGATGALQKTLDPELLSRKVSRLLRA